MIRSERMSRSFGALRVRNYRLYLGGQMVSQIGTWMQRTAQAWLVLDMTGSPLALGTVTAVQFVPVLFFTLWGGALADRVAKRDLLVVTQTLQMLQAFALGILVLTGTVQLWQVYALALVLGITSAVDQPARRALASELVEREYVASAVALNSAQLNAARVVGPALGGLGIVLVGVAGCFLVNGVSFLAVIVALMMMRSSEFQTRAYVGRTGLASQIIEGFVYSWRTPEIAFTFILVGFLGAFGYNWNVVLPLLARFALDSSALGFGGLNSALGIGSLAGAMFAAGQGRTTVRALARRRDGFFGLSWLAGSGPVLSGRHRPAAGAGVLERHLFDYGEHACPVDRSTRAARAGDGYLQPGVCGDDATRRRPDGRRCRQLGHPRRTGHQCGVLSGGCGARSAVFAVAPRARGVRGGRPRALGRVSGYVANVAIHASTTRRECAKANSAGRLAGVNQRNSTRSSAAHMSPPMISAR